MSDKEEVKEENQMSFLEHLEELRWHLMRSVIAVMAFAIVAFIFYDFIFNVLILAPPIECSLYYLTIQVLKH